ncbi:MAG TPA: hypothetical protein VN698_06830 [Bacteroidia bacterium]|nr:hypothetical protein [Bacteroidia bacterium]
MKKIKTKALAVGIVAFMVLFTSCKKEQGTQGAQGPQGPAGLVTAYSNGFIKGSFSGTRRDGTIFNESFSYSVYWDVNSSVLDSVGVGNFVFDITRGTDILSQNTARLQINTASPTSSTALAGYLNFVYVKSIGANQLFAFATSSSVPVTFSSLSYNKSTGLYTGSFMANLGGPDNNTKNPATITGTFQVNIKQVYYFTKHVSATKVD